MNPAITTGTSPYMGERRTRGHHHRFYHSNLYGSGQATLYHGHSGHRCLSQDQRPLRLSRCGAIAMDTVDQRG